MVKLYFIALLLCALACPAPAALPQFNSPAGTAAQDSTGVVWTMPPDNSTGVISRWQAGTGAQGGKWVMQAVPGAAGFLLEGVTRADNGLVYGVWEKQQWQAPFQCLVTVHHGSSRVLAQFEGKVVRDGGNQNLSLMYAGANGSLWIVGHHLTLWHITPDGSVQSFPLSPVQYFHGWVSGDFQSESLTSLVDGAGRSWFWQYPIIPDAKQNGLRGVLIWDGKMLDYHPTLAGVPDRSFSAMTPLDANHLWLAEDGDDFVGRQTIHGGLYRVDTRTLSAVPETPPEPGAFQNITQIFQANGDWYVVENPAVIAPAVLWRRHAGVWRKVLSSPQTLGVDDQSGAQYSWLAEPSGTWLGVGGGAWWLPRSSQPPLWVNWRRGLPVQNVTSLFRLPDGLVLTADSRDAGEMPPTPQPARPLPPGITTGGMGAPEHLGPLVADPRRHLWGMQSSDVQKPSLAEWDGRRWRVHPPPPGTTGITNIYACDTRGRLWLTTYEWNPPAQPNPINGYAIYDPAQDTWTNYAAQQDALAASASLPDMAFLPRRDLYPSAVFSGDGRVAYVSGSTEVSLYDGKLWHQWQSKNIISPSYGGNSPSHLRFNEQGHLEVTLDIQIREWTSEGGWQQAGVQNPVPYQNPVPSGGPRGLWNIPSVDDTGAKWFVWQGAVYTAAFGLWAKQNELSAPGSPFRLGYGIGDVLRDPVGHLFFVSNPTGQYDYVVWSPPPVPAPALSVVPVSDDSMTVRFGKKLAGPHWILWRLNGGAWSAPTTERVLTLSALARGDYRLEAETLDLRLQTSTPAAAVWSVQVSPETQIAGWVRTLLSGSDAAREAAAAGLVKQPAAALPALQAARPGASEAGRWWIDAAVQQIQSPPPN